MPMIDMTPKHPVLNTHNCLNGNVHVFSEKQIHVDIDTLATFVIQSRQMS